MMVSVARYLNIPFMMGGRTRKGCSCWGIVYMIETEVFGRSCPVYSNEPNSGDMMEQEALVANENSNWTTIPRGEEKPGDVVVLKIRNYHCHCGVVLGDGWMIHTLKPHGSCRERYDRFRWKPNVVGFRRFPGWEVA
jgi:cell wall-associated NlpC family hydrolase